MRETLEDLYYGNITPYDRQIRSSTSLMKAMEQSQECEEQLTKLLEGEAHSLLLRLINAENEIGSTLTLENFILGFRLGTRLILESLDVRTMAVWWNCSAEINGGRDKDDHEPTAHPPVPLLWQ